jgi:hypothetical protein
VRTLHRGFTRVVQTTRHSARDVLLADRRRDSVGT